MWAQTAGLLPLLAIDQKHSWPGMPLSTKPRGCLYDAVAEIAEKSGTVNPRILGRWIEKNAGRILGGMRLVRSCRRDKNKTHWFVEIMK